MRKRSALILWTVIGMVGCLLAQGLFLFARDAVTRQLPHMFVVSDCMWMLALMSLIFVRRSPTALLLMAWTSVVVFTAVLQPNSARTGFTWFVESNCLMLLDLLFANVVFFASRAGRKRRGEPRFVY